jgi:hypothetical protein
MSLVKEARSLVQTSCDCALEPSRVNLFTQGQRAFRIGPEYPTLLVYAHTLILLEDFTSGVRASAGWLACKIITYRCFCLLNSKTKLKSYTKKY